MNPEKSRLTICEGVNCGPNNQILKDELKPAIESLGYNCDFRNCLQLCREGSANAVAMLGLRRIRSFEAVATTHPDGSVTNRIQEVVAQFSEIAQNPPLPDIPAWNL